MRPALVWGCVRKPSSSRAAISLRIVALETPRPELSAIVSDPTGSPERTYSSTTAFRTAPFRGPSSWCCSTMTSCYWHSRSSSARRGSTPIHGVERIQELCGGGLRVAAPLRHLHVGLDRGDGFLHHDRAILLPAPPERAGVLGEHHDCPPERVHAEELDVDEIPADLGGGIRDRRGRGGRGTRDRSVFGPERLREEDDGADPDDRAHDQERQGNTRARDPTAGPPVRRSAVRAGPGARARPSVEPLAADGAPHEAPR